MNNFTWNNININYARRNENGNHTFSNPSLFHTIFFVSFCFICHRTVNFYLKIFCEFSGEFNYENVLYFCVHYKFLSRFCRKTIFFCLIFICYCWSESKTNLKTWILIFGEMFSRNYVETVWLDFELLFRYDDLKSYALYWWSYFSYMFHHRWFWSD